MLLLLSLLRLEDSSVLVFKSEDDDVDDEDWIGGALFADSLGAFAG